MIKRIDEAGVKISSLNVPSRANQDTGNSCSQLMVTLFISVNCKLLWLKGIYILHMVQSMGSLEEWISLFYGNKML